MTTAADLGASASYSANPLRADRDELRLLINDRGPDFLLTDSEIDGAMQLAQRTGNPAGTLSASVLAVNGTTAAGATEIALDATTVTGGVLPGASFTIAGNSQRYFVSGEVDASSNALTVEFWPGLVASATDDAAVTFRLFDIFEAGAICHEIIAGHFAQKPAVTIDGRSESYTNAVAYHTERARVLRRQSTSAGGTFGAKLVRV